MISNKYQADQERDYVDIQDHALIGNLHTAAMVSGRLRVPFVDALMNTLPYRSASMHQVIQPVEPDNSSG